MKNNVRNLLTGAAKVAGASALAVLVGSGTLGIAHAAQEVIADNSVTSAKIKDGAVKSIDIKDNTVSGVDVLDGSVAAPDIATDGVGSSEIAANGVGSAEITNGAVTSDDILNGTIDSNELNSNLRPRWVKIAGNANPTNFLRGRGIVSVSRVGVGQFDVTFDTNITACGWFATRNDNSAGAAGPGEIAVEQATNVDPTKLRIRTFDSAGAAADPASDDGFSLMVLC